MKIKKLIRSLVRLIVLISILPVQTLAHPHTKITEQLVEQYKSMFERIVVQTPVTDPYRCRAEQNPVFDNLIAEYLVPHLLIDRTITVITNSKKFSITDIEQTKKDFYLNFGTTPDKLNFNLKYPPLSYHCNLYLYLKRFLAGENVRFLMPHSYQPGQPIVQQLPLHQMPVVYYLINGQREYYINNNTIIYPFYYGSDTPAHISIKMQNTPETVEIKTATLAQFFAQLEKSNKNYQPQLWIPNMTPQNNMNFTRQINLHPAYYELMQFLK